jgi:sigma-E factor negative regulatory protein RseC
VRALNTAGARAGDKVVVAIEEDALVRGSVAVYFMPLAAMLIAGLAADALVPAGHDGLVALSALAGLLLGLTWLRAFAIKIRGDRRYQPTIVRRMIGVTSQACPPAAAP